MGESVELNKNNLDYLVDYEVKTKKAISPTVNDVLDSLIRLGEDPDVISLLESKRELMVASDKNGSQFWENRNKTSSEALEIVIDFLKGGDEKKKQYSPSDFPSFRDLYNQYMFREIGKKEFSEILGISRTELEKLIDDFTKKRD